MPEQLRPLYTVHMTESSDRLMQQLSFAIRNPINVILGTLDLHSTTTTTPEQDHYLRMVRRSAQQLLDTSESLLDLYEMESGRMTPQAEEFNVSELILETVKFKESLARAKGLEIHVLLDSTLPNAGISDPQIIRKILSQLFDNAIKYTDSGSIELRAGAPSGALKISVRDTGVGIANHRLPAIFQGPTEDSYSSGFGGSGLGLLLVSRMLQVLNGTVHVESRPGQGSDFKVELPIQKAEEKPAPTMHLSGGQPEMGEGIRILCAEDDPDGRYLLEHHMQARNWHVALATNGKEAVELCRQAPFDLILMDVQMPEMDGFEATAAIRNLPTGSSTQGQAVPIIALTAHALKQDREICLQAGMDDYLSKPVHREELYSTIEYHLGAARKRKEI
ncbi:MAG: response regulator [Leptospiraceae bacterium]|nr:response regulator [Leptospiraceae bacterium]